jgi:choline dehydrogenase
MLYLRGQARDYDQWRQLGNPGWGWDDVLPYFKRHEDHYAGADEMHGTHGEWRVEQQRLSWELLDAFADGDNLGVSYFQVNQRAGWRWNTARGFLKPAKGRKNLTILTHAQAESLILQGRRATGVCFRQSGQPREARARAEVILSAGAIGSPHLMQLSGIGPGQHLQDHAIPVVHDLPGVGANLQDHLQLRCAYRVEGVETLNQRAGSLLGKAGIALEYLLKRTGPMSMAPSQLGAFAKSSEAVETADLEYHVQPLTLNKFGDPLDPFPAFTASVCHLRPESRGTVRLTSPDPTAHPEIAPNYLSTEADRQIAAQAIRLTRRIVAQAPLARYRPQEFRPGPEVGDDDAALARAAGEIGTTIFHPVGTAKMGTDPAAVVDARLRVHGIEGLRVIDASVMPTITSGNTNSPVIMIAEKGAVMVCADARAGG